MKRITLLASAMLLSASVLAESNVSYDYGTVVDTTPIVKTIRVSTPRKECWDENVSYTQNRDSDSVGTVVGAIIGGALGNAVGHHNSNKKVGAVVGAVLGGTVGNAIAKDNNRGDITTHGTQEVCKVINDYREEERIVGYQVRYRYNNETYTTRTDVDPGDTIKLRLAVTPVS